MVSLVGVLLFWCGVGGLIGYAIGNSKGRGTEGFWLGFLLGIIGWIIEAFAQPTAEVQAQRAALVSVVQAQADQVQARSSDRACPWCAELIKPAAKVCRFCGRDVEPLFVHPEAAQTDEATELEHLRLDFPAVYDEARGNLDRLNVPPLHPAAWLAELCRRLEAGSPADAAVARTPLDWSRQPPPPPVPVATATHSRDPAGAGKFPDVAHDHPAAYDRARSQLAGLDPRPDNPQAWLRELCRRIDAGSPPEAAAARIPLDHKEAHTSR